MFHIDSKFSTHKKQLTFSKISLIHVLCLYVYMHVFVYVPTYVPVFVYLYNQFPLNEINVLIIIIDNKNCFRKEEKWYRGSLYISGVAQAEKLKTYST